MAKGKEKPPANPVGRPTDYRPEYCQLLIDHMTEGLSFESFGAVVDAHKETLYTWTEKHSEFLDAKKRGTVRSMMVWEKAGGLRSLENKDFSSTLWYMNMKNRFGWRDNQNMPEWVKILLDNIGKLDEDQLLAVSENLTKDIKAKRQANE